MSSQRAFGLALLLILLPYAVYIALHDVASLVRFFPDDAFYYLEPARHFAHFGWPSFDGLHSTNGFHPLHFLVVTLSAWLDNRHTQLAAMFLSTAAITIASLACLSRAALPTQPNCRTGLFLTLSLPPCVALFITNAGMESCLVLCTAVFVWLAASAALDRQFLSYRQNVLCGIAIAVFLLSRLDNLIACAVLVGYLVVRLARPTVAAPARTKAAMAASLFLPPFVLCGSYLLLNLATTGHITPINAFVKMHEHTPLAVSWQSATRGSMAGFVLGIAPLILSLLIICRGLLRYRNLRRLWNAKFPTLIALNAGNVLYFAYLLGWASNFHRWYFAFPYAISLMNVACVAGEILRRRNASRGDAPHAVHTRMSRTGATTTAVLLLINISTCYAFLTWFGGRPNSTSFQLWQVSRKLNHTLPDGAIVGTYDAGVLGFFSNATVINLDGLCNNFEYYLEYKQPHRLLEYVRKNHVSHLLVRDALMRFDNQNGRPHITFLPDPRIELSQDRECFIHEIPGQFSVHCFALNLD